MASEPEKTSDSEKEIVDVENLSDEKKNVEENAEIELTANPKREDRKRPKACDEDPYIVKLFKSLMNPQESQESSEKKKK